MTFVFKRLFDGYSNKTQITKTLRLSIICIEQITRYSIDEVNDVLSSNVDCFSTYTKLALRK